MRQAMTALAMVCVWLCGCAPELVCDNTTDQDKLLIFHNNSGPMCLQAMEWLDLIESQYSDLVIEEHLTHEANGLVLLAQWKSQFDQSQGVSTNFGYLPIVFFRGHAFSGFNDEVRDALAAIIDAACASSS